MTFVVAKGITAEQQEIRPGEGKLARVQFNKMQGGMRITIHEISQLLLEATE